MAYRSGPTKYDFIPKSGQLGQQFLMFEREQAATGDAGWKTCELYDNAWKFFRAGLEPLELVFRTGKKLLTSEQRKTEEQQIVTALRQQRDIRTTNPVQCESCRLVAAAKNEPQQKCAACGSRVKKIEAATPATVNTYIRVMKTWVNWMSDEDRGAFLQFDWSKALDKLNMNVPTTNGQTRTVWTNDQIDLWLRFRPGPNKFNQWRVWTIGVLMLDVGLRIDEALDLDVEDVKFDNEMIGVWRKGNKYQLLPVNPEAMKHLFRYKNKWIDPYRTRGDVKWYFFGTHDGMKTSQRNALRDLKVVLKKAGICTTDPTDPKKKRLIPDLSWHEYRHTTATKRLENGEPLDKVQRLLGHSDPKTTAIYLHMTEEYLRDGHNEHSPLNRINRLPRR